MRRSYCERCQYPSVVCVCQFVKRIDNQTNIVVLQHPKESDHAKNTAKLAVLCFANIEVVRLPKSLTVDAPAIASLPTYSNEHQSALLYPSEHSSCIDDFLLRSVKATSQSNQGNPDSCLQTLYVLDGSWRQAYAIFKSNSWLADLPQVHLRSIPEKKYEIRKSKSDHQLSTIEAIAYAISEIEKRKTHVAIDLLTAFTEQFQSFSKH